jgi:hypothetical protein
MRHKLCDVIGVLLHFDSDSTFPSCQFGDIVGFTAWASTREPTAVFMLLEGLYSAFDKIALRRKVMKIETGRRICLLPMNVSVPRFERI